MIPFVKHNTCIFLCAVLDTHRMNNFALYFSFLGNIFLCVVHVQWVCIDKYRRQILFPRPTSDSRIFGVHLGFWRFTGRNNQFECKLNFHN